MQVLATFLDTETLQLLSFVHSLMRSALPFRKSSRFASIGVSDWPRRSHLRGRLSTLLCVNIRFPCGVRFSPVWVCRDRLASSLYWRQAFPLFCVHNNFLFRLRVGPCQASLCVKRSAFCAYAGKAGNLGIS